MTNDEPQLVNALSRLQPCTSDRLAEDLTGITSLATIKRVLASLVEQGAVQISERGQATTYSLSPSYEVLRSIDVKAYFAQEIDERPIHATFNWDLIEKTLVGLSLFTPAEMAHLTGLSDIFGEHIAAMDSLTRRKEMERLAIDLSWKSSQIEGNTYSLLETERLLRDRQTAGGKTHEEATMLLNHKAAIDFLVEHPDFLTPLTVSGIEDVHFLLTKDLSIGRNIRNVRVGITGTNYRPLDNDFQIREALEMACGLINSSSDPFQRALLAITLLSYIQPFEDGNKRTARIVGNAMLLAGSACPLSYRTVDTIDYQKAILIFYEQGNISAFKAIFTSQYEFAVSTYF